MAGKRVRGRTRFVSGGREAEGCQWSPSSEEHKETTPPMLGKRKNTENQEGKNGEESQI